VTAAIHLQPTAPLAGRVLLPGDPGRALLLAQALLEQPRMFNHNRGLWGYTGTASDGQELTIQSTGMGGPSAAIVVSELAQLGARQLLRVGTCGALEQTLLLGDVVIVTEALCADGASRALGAGERVPANRELLSALIAAADGEARVGLIASVDLFYGLREVSFAEQGALALEMETATLFALGQLHEELDVASALIVSDTLIPSRTRISADQLRVAEHRLGELALKALKVAPSVAATA
jgi:DeoD family purine-nucleoside phosphorylase